MRTFLPSFLLFPPSFWPAICSASFVSTSAARSNMYSRGEADMAVEGKALSSQAAGTWADARCLVPVTSSVVPACTWGWAVAAGVGQAPCMAACEGRLMHVVGWVLEVEAVVSDTAAAAVRLGVGGGWEGEGSWVVSGLLMLQPRRAATCCWIQRVRRDMRAGAGDAGGTWGLAAPAGGVVSAGPGPGPGPAPAAPVDGACIDVVGS
mmetsp:Transcript_9512/g.20280  ORF Transcript_9512/g.20280 Transcript_9512/m.20280 type:complete len:207 (-) Transcript_9512:1024-1644(-)